MPHRRGLSLLTIASVLGRVLAVLQSVVIGFLLSPEDYGAFAVALGVLMFTGLFRAGGIWMVLGSIPNEEFKERAPTVFWVGMIIGGIGCLVTAVASIPGIGVKEVPGSSLVLIVLGAQFALLPLQQMAQMKLGGEHGYGSIAATVLTCSILKFVVAIATAWFGLGPLALALPQVLGTLIEAVFYGRAAKLDRSYFRFSPNQVWSALRYQLPVLPIAALNSINTQGDYFIGSLFLTTASLGLYSFAYQIASQPYMVLTMALQRVLVPRSVASQSSAQHSEYLAGMATTVFFMVPAVCVGLGISFPAIEQVVWGGRWKDSTELVTILSIGLSGPLALAILITPLLAARRYSIVLATEAIRGASVLCGGALGALVLSKGPWFEGDPIAEAKGLALGVCLVTTVSSAGTGIWLLTAAGLRLRPMAESLLVGPAACALAGYGSWSVAHSLVRSFDALGSRGGAAVVATITLVLYGLILFGALQLLPSLRAAYVNVAEPGLEGLKRFAQRLHLPVGD
jgi:O-antigen/teichoic acid export membrane protein